VRCYTLLSLTSLDPSIPTTGHKRRRLSSVPILCLKTRGKYLQLHEPKKYITTICREPHKLRVHYNSSTPTKELTRNCSIVKFVGSESALGVSSRIYEEGLDVGWLTSIVYGGQGLGVTQREGRRLISGLSLGAKAMFLSCNTTQSRAVTGLLTGHNTLKRHLHLLGLSVHCVGVEQRMKPRPIMFVSVKLWFHSDVYLNSCLEPEDTKTISLGAIWNFPKATGLP
jgi:hypothetical protein